MPTYIKDLDPDTPPRVSLAEAESTATWDDEIRAVKEAYQNEFPNIDGAVTVTQKELNSTIDRIERAGDQMTDQLIAAADPVDDYDLVTKQWVEALFQVPPTNPGDDYAYGYIDLVEIPQSPLVFGSLYTQTNTLTDTPSKWIVKLVCIEGEYGYEAGDEVHVIGPQSDDTDNNLKVGGIQPFNNSTEVGLQVGAAVFILDRSPEYTGRFREVTPSRWELTGQAIQIGRDPAKCTPGYEWTLLDDDLVNGDLYNAFIDRTNNKFITWVRSIGQSLMYVWNLSTNELDWQILHTDGVPNNNVCNGFGYSTADDENIDRYLKQSNGSGSSTLRAYDINGDYQGGKTFGNNEGRTLSSFVECNGYIVCSYDEVTLQYRPQVFTKDLTTHLSNDNNPANYSFSPLKAQIVGEDYFLQAYRSQTNNRYYFGRYTPDVTLGGSASAVYDTGLDEATWNLRGATYDGTNIWVFFFGNSQAGLLKLATTGETLDTVTLSTNAAITSGRAETWQHVDYVPSLGEIAVFYRDLDNGSNMHFFNPTTQAVTPADYALHEDKQKYSASKCSAYTNEYHDFGQGAGDEWSLVKSCNDC